jgi:hypothetical protein
MTFKTKATGPVSASPLGPATGLGERVIETGLAEAASYGLVPLAFELVLGTDSPLTMPERAEVTAILARKASPVRFFSALHRETRLAALARYPGKFNLHEIQKLEQDKVGPAFEAVGAILELLSTEKQKPGALTDWFSKLGMFAFWVAQKQAHEPGSRGRDSQFYDLLSGPEAMDIIMSLEAELLERADDFGAKGTAHEIIEPLADALKSQLQ